MALFSPKKIFYIYDMRSQGNARAAGSKPFQAAGGMHTPLRRALPGKGLAVNHVLKRYRVKATNPIGYVAEHFGGNGLLYLPILSGKSCRAVLKQVV